MVIISLQIWKFSYVISPGVHIMKFQVNLWSKFLVFKLLCYIGLDYNFFYTGIFYLLTAKAWRNSWMPIAVSRFWGINWFILLAYCIVFLCMSLSSCLPGGGLLFFCFTTFLYLVVCYPDSCCLVSNFCSTLYIVKMCNSS